MKILFSIFISILFMLTACKPAPDAIDSKDKPLYLSEQRDKWLVINYWATWCKPCLTELPELNALHVENTGKLVVLGVSFDNLSAVDIQKFSDKLRLTFSMFSNFPITKFGVQEIPALPVTYIIDPQGKLSSTLYGPQTQQSILAEIK